MSKNLFVLGLVIFFFRSTFSQTASDVAVQAYVTAQSSPPTFTINWTNNTSTNSYQISKKLKNSSTWTTLATGIPSTTTQYIDNNVSGGVEYEYRIIRSGTSGTVNYTGYGFVAAGIDIQPTHFRGKCILMIANTLTPSLQTEIGQFIRDLEGDGWQVITAYTPTNAAVSAVKNQIKSLYQLDTANTKCLILIGHVPVPYSGAMAPDAHPDHVGAWPADVYYADMDGNWTDITANTTPTNTPRIVNTPGDGKFDQSYLPSPTELYIGRIDLSSMPAFTLSEVQLMKNYFNKNHDYRMMNFIVNPAGLIDDNFGYFSGEAFAANGWRNFSSLVGPMNVSASDYFSTMSNSVTSCLWSYGCGGGSYTSASGIGTTSNFTTSSLHGVFTILFGSYFGDWDVNNNFLRAPLCQGKMLTCLWAGRPNWWLHHMGLGEPIGYSARLTQNNAFTNFYAPGGYFNGGVHVALMGDPTLRNKMVLPPQSVTATFNGHDAVINWTPSTQTNVVGYHVYMKNDSNNVYVKINNLPVSGNSFTHQCQTYQATYTYMVRAMALENSWSGTYYNLSQGVVDTAYHSNSLAIYASPTVIITSTPTVFQFSCSAQGAYTYQWFFGDGNSSSLQNPLHTYTANGNYVVTLVIGNQCNTATYTMSVNVTGLNSSEHCIQNSKLRIYPVPAHHRVHIMFDEPVNEWYIINMAGKKVCNGTQSKIILSVSDWAEGVYFIKYSNKEKISKAVRFMVFHN